MFDSIAVVCQFVFKASAACSEKSVKRLEHKNLVMCLQLYYAEIKPGLWGMKVLSAACRLGISWMPRWSLAWTRTAQLARLLAN